MFVDIYQYFKNAPNVNRRMGNNCLLLEYKCPINVEDFQLWSDSHMISYVISGRKDWFSGNQTIKMNTGDAVFIKKGVYSTKQYLEEDFCTMMFFINDDFIKEFVRQYDLRNQPSGPTMDHQNIALLNTDQSFDTLIKSMFHYLTSKGSIPDDLVELKFKELIFNLSLNPQNHQFRRMITDIAQTAKTNLEYVMNQNFQYDLSLSALARLSGRSLSTFKRDFKKYFGTTPAKWLLQKRLSHSKGLILNSNLNVSDISYESGFKNTSHFIRCFKKEYGITPAQLKKEGVIS